MLFKKLYITEDCKYEVDDTKVIHDILNSPLKPCEDLEPNSRVHRTYQQITCDLITALMLCHNVTPVI